MAAAVASKLRPEVQAVLDVARSQLGVRETSRNSGPQVDGYLRAVDNPPGAPWCASFVYWCIREGMKRFPAVPIPYVKSAYCPTVLTWAQDLGLVHTDPAPGDTFLLLYGGRARHTGFVAEVLQTNVRSLEGNTDPAGGSDGDGVYQRARPISAAYQYVRWADLLPPLQQAETGRFALVFEGKQVGIIPVIQGRAFAPVRLWGELVGQVVKWNPEIQTCSLDNKPIDSPITLIDGKGHAPLRVLASLAHKAVNVDPDARTIVVS
jgi:hypothetical protein